MVSENQVSIAGCGGAFVQGQSGLQGKSEAMAT